MDAASARRRSAERRRLFGATAVSATAHVALGVALLVAWTKPPPTIEPPSITVDLVNWQQPPAPQPPSPQPPAPSAAAAPASPAKVTPQRSFVRPSPAPPDADSLPADNASTTQMGAQLSEAQLAGASGADAGGGGGGACDMARSLQRALRRDPMVQAAVASLSGKAIMVWNGDWVQNTGEDGKGLAAVREAIMWEVAFAPKACRSEPVRGLIVLSMNTAPGAPRLAVGSGEWRWSDLLRPTPTISESR